MRIWKTGDNGYFIRVFCLSFNSLQKCCYRLNYEYYYVIFFADDFIARSTTGVGIFFTRFYFIPEI